MTLHIDDERFRVVGIGINTVWLRPQRPDSSQKNVRVPIWSQDYDGPETDVLNRLGNGDIVRASLHSDSEKPPSWRVDEIEMVG